MKIFVGLVSLVTLFIIAFLYLRPKNIPAVKARKIIQGKLDKIVEGPKHISQGLIHVSSPEHGFEETFVSGKLNGEAIQADLPFHVASIGKLFTSVLIAKLCEKGLLSFNDPISKFLPMTILSGLFTYEDVDYSDRVTVAMLLSHTSGVADYFEDHAIESPDLVDLVNNDPNRFWKPSDLIEFTRTHQRPVAKPGEKFHYSDTGYILLGLIIEEVLGEPLGQALNRNIFEPVGMKDTYLLFYDHASKSRPEFADVWLNGKNIKEYKSLSIDWAGGGIISTLEDLKLFILALYKGNLISDALRKQLENFEHTFRRGLQYGHGIMEIRFKDLFFSLGFIPNMRGHMGVLGTTLFYDEETERLYVSSFGSTDFSAGSIKTMIQVMSTIERVGHK